VGSIEPGSKQIGYVLAAPHEGGAEERIAVSTKSQGKIGI